MKLLAISLFLLANLSGTDWVTPTPSLSNGHLSVLEFSQHVNSCQMGTTELKLFKQKDKLLALAVIPHEYSDPYITIKCKGENMLLEKQLLVLQAQYESRQINVDKKYTEKKSKELLTRINKEKKQITDALARQDDQKYWQGPFIWPRQDKVTSPYGARRLYNGKQKSVHQGLDIDGQMGDSIQAMADGRVALAAMNFFYPGTIVIIDHGLGLQSLYMHMSALAVKTGDMVKKGQLIGKVGKSGRVTGPHLHWGTKLYGTYFYPGDLLTESMNALLSE